MTTCGPSSSGGWRYDIRPANRMVRACGCRGRRGLVRGRLLASLAARTRSTGVMADDLTLRGDETPEERRRKEAAIAAIFEAAHPSIVAEVEEERFERSRKRVESSPRAYTRNAP